MILKNNKNLELIVDDDLPETLINQRWTILSKRNDVPYAIMGKWIPGENKTKIIYLHRLITNAQPGQIVDHINGNTLDNRLCNLRVCSNKENIRNSKVAKNNTSGYKGVHKHKSGKFYSKIEVDAKVIRLGNFETKEEAALAYNEAAKKYFGEFARPNIILEVK